MFFRPSQTCRYSLLTAGNDLRCGLLSVAILNIRIHTLTFSQRIFVFDNFSLFYYMFYRKTRLFLRFFKIPRHLVGAGELYSIKELNP